MAQEDPPPPEDDRGDTAAAADDAAPQPEISPAGDAVAALDQWPEDLDGYCVVGPGPADRPRLSWTARRASPDRYFIDEAFGGAPRLTIGPLPAGEITGFIAGREAEARSLYESTLRRFERQPAPVESAAAHTAEDQAPRDDGRGPLQATPDGVHLQEHAPHDDLRARLERWRQAAREHHPAAPPRRIAQPTPDLAPEPALGELPLAEPPVEAPAAGSPRGTAALVSPAVAAAADQAEHDASAPDQVAAPGTDTALSPEQPAPPPSPEGSDTDEPPASAFDVDDPPSHPAISAPIEPAHLEAPAPRDAPAPRARGLIPSLMQTVVGSVGARTTGMLKARAVPRPAEQKQALPTQQQDPDPFDQEPGPIETTDAPAPAAASSNEEVVAATLRAIQDLLATQPGGAD